MDVSLHHAAPGRWALKVRSVMAASETGSVARPGALAGSRLHHLGSRGGCDRRGRHGRRRRLHQPRLSGPGHPVGLFDPVAVDRRRHRRAVRGVFLRGAWRDVSALERRVQLPRPGLSPGLRFRGGLGIGDRRLFGACRARGDGVWRVRQIGAAGRATARARARRGVAGVAGAAHRRQALLARFNWSRPS